MVILQILIEEETKYEDGKLSATSMVRWKGEGEKRIGRWLQAVMVYNGIIQKMQNILLKKQPSKAQFFFFIGLLFGLAHFFLISSCYTFFFIGLLFGLAHFFS